MKCILFFYSATLIDDIADKQQSVSMPGDRVAYIRVQEVEASSVTEAQKQCDIRLGEVQLVPY